MFRKIITAGISIMPFGFLNVWDAFRLCFQLTPAKRRD